MVSTAAEHRPPPDGIADSAAEPERRSLLAGLKSLILLGTLVALALSGVLGGGKNVTERISGEAATLSVNKPRHVRNGQFFETRILIEAKQPIADTVLALSPSLWRDLTVNTMIPAASEEEFKDGFFRFSYGALKAGERIEVKIDSQINPALVGTVRGPVGVFDGKRPLVQRPLQMTVLP